MPSVQCFPRFDSTGEGWQYHFKNAIGQAKESLILCSPYISQYGCTVVRSSLDPKYQHSGRIVVITDLSPEAICYGATEPESIRSLVSATQNLCVKHLPRLHAKVFITDFDLAIVTSANLTHGGLCNNFEYGIRISERPTVQLIRNDIEAYASLGAEVDQHQLEKYCEIAREVRHSYRQTRRNIRTEVKRRFQAVVQHADEELIRLKLSGGAMHTVFADTVLYLLRKWGPLTTAELHTRIEAIHPDLCDNDVDRVIDGKRFGKKWKHAVRTAQQQLKRRDLIELREEQWHALQ